MTWRFTGLSAAILLFASLTVRGGVKTESVEYKSGDAVLEGYLAYSSEAFINKVEKRPAIIVVHEWWGLNDYPKLRARQLAELGYVAFAADIYGKGKATDKPDEAGKLAGKYKGDRALMRERLKAAVDTVRSR